MKPAHFLGSALTLALLAAASGAHGQSSVVPPQSFGVAAIEGLGPGAQTTTLTAMPPSLCAVGLQARHLAYGDVMEAGSKRPKGRGQRLHLTFTSPDTRTIASATVNVYGWDRAGVVTAGAESSGTKTRAEAVRKLNVILAAGQGRAASADVWAPNLNSVTSIELLSITFTDLSTWTPAAGHVCRVAPDPLMLVSQ